MIHLLLAAGLAHAQSLPSIDTPPAGLPKDLTGDAALILAVEDYSDLPDVPGARANALAWQAFLKARGVPVVKLMLNGDVTRENVLGDERADLEGAARQVRRMVKPGGTVWVVFIGHGAPGAGAGAMVGQDAKRTASSVVARGFEQDELLDALGSEEGVPIVAVIDACFSGRTAQGELAPGVQPVRPPEVALPAQTRTTLMVAAREDQYAGAYPGLGRPAFSWLVLGGLRGWADEDRDGRVTAAEVVSWSGLRLFEAVNDHEQTPEVFGVKDRALIGRRMEPAPELVARVDAGETVHPAVSAPSRDAGRVEPVTPAPRPVKPVPTSTTLGATSPATSPRQAPTTSTARVEEPPRRGARTALWVVDLVVAGAGAAGVIGGQLQANALEQDIADGVVEDWERASERQTRANVTMGLGYGGLAVGAGLGAGLVVTRPIDGGWVLGLEGRF